MLLDLFPAIRALPDRLKVFSSMKVYGMSEADDRAQFGDIYRRPITDVDSWARCQRGSPRAHCRMLAYQPLARTFCIAAIEAQAAGCRCSAR